MFCARDAQAAKPRHARPPAPRARPFAPRRQGRRACRRYTIADHPAAPSSFAAIAAATENSACIRTPAIPTPPPRAQGPRARARKDGEGLRVLKAPAQRNAQQQLPRRLRERQPQPHRRRAKQRRAHAAHEVDRRDPGTHQPQPARLAARACPLKRAPRPAPRRATRPEGRSAAAGPRFRAGERGAASAIPAPARKRAAPPWR